MATPHFTRTTSKITALTALTLALGACVSMPPSTTELESRRKEVVQHELVFAKTMADRNFAGFASFLSNESVFFDGDVPLPGPTAIKHSWQPLYQSAKAPFSWEPKTVVVLASGDLALSSGPVRNADGKVIAQFNSIWRRVGAGRWKVVFDKGCELCPCAQR